MAMGSKAYESPLISHARMRAMYRGLVEVRALLGRKRGARGLEAAWVATAMDLQDGDLASDAGSAGEAALLAYIRAIGARDAAGAPRASDVKQIRRELLHPQPESFPGSESDRLIYSAGAAMALKTAEEERVVMAYTGKAGMSAKEWRRVLAVMSQEGLPLVLMALPGASDVDLDAIARKAAPAQDRVIPVIPVDGGDVVALYRVAQETIGRARAGGGAAIITAVDLATDPVKLLGTQLVKKGICTERWVGDVDPKFRAMLHGAG